MDITENWRARFERDYVPFSTWATAAQVAAGTVVYCVATAQISVVQTLTVLIPFACALPAMVSARLAVAFRQNLRTEWQLLPLSALCGFVTMAGFVLLYALSMIVAMWNPSEYEPFVLWPDYERAVVVGLLQKAIDYGLIPAALGAVVAGINAGLWLHRERRERQADSAENTGEAISLPSPVVASGRSYDARNEARYFWFTTAFGPVIIALMLALLLNGLLAPGGIGPVQQLLWFVLRLYYGGTFAASVAAALILALVFDRSRGTAWPASLCVGLHAGAIFLLLFVPAEGNAERQPDIQILGAVMGALSAAACTAIWFPNRRGQHLGDRCAEVGLRGWAATRFLVIAGFVAPLAAALSYCLFIAVAPAANAWPDGTFIGRLRSFEPEIWAIACRIWAVVALQTLALHYLLPAKNIRAVAIVILPLFAFLFAGGMGHSLGDYVMSKPMAISFSSFAELGLPGLVAALVALYLTARPPARRRRASGRAVA